METPPPVWPVAGKGRLRGQRLGGGLPGSLQKRPGRPTCPDRHVSGFGSPEIVVLKGRPQHTCFSAALLFSRVGAAGQCVWWCPAAQAESGVDAAAWAALVRRRMSPRLGVRRVALRVHGEKSRVR